MGKIETTILEKIATESKESLEKSIIEGIILCGYSTDDVKTNMNNQFELTSINFGMSSIDVGSVVQYILKDKLNKKSFVVAEYQSFNDGFNIKTIIQARNIEIPF